MTEKQKSFCEHYLETNNATEAAIKAGYKKNTAYHTGYENLKKPQIKAYIEKKLNQESSKRIANIVEVLEFFTLIMRGERNEQDEQPNFDTRIKAASELLKRYKFTKSEEIENLNLELLHLEKIRKELEINKFKTESLENQDKEILVRIEGV
ncbi:MAG: terminase small subunit [Cetobacterium sp.]